MLHSLRRGDGTLYLTLEHNKNENWIHAHWYGYQTLGTVMDGGLTYLDLIRQDPCPKLLNDHRDLVGTFTDANEWIQQIWTPLTINSGLRYIGQVVSPDVFGQLSIEDLKFRISDQLDIHLFDSLEETEEWLRAQP
jgi:hypothetical protein